MSGLNPLGLRTIFPRDYDAPMPAIPPAISTVQQLRALPADGRRHELLDGVHVVTRPPDRHHQGAVRGLLKTFGRQLDGRRDYEVMISPSELVLGPATFVQPDLFIVKQNPGQPIRSWDDVGVPALVVEVASTETAERDRVQKRQIYLAAGVDEYWIVDLTRRVVDRWRAGWVRPEVVRETIAWALSGDAAGTIDLAGYFSETLRED